MAVNLSPYGGVGAQFLDNSGNVLTGGKIYTYAGGTTTPQATYTTSTGATPHSNPIVLDASGRVPGGEIWLTDGLVYKFVLKDSNDVLIATYDGITGINSNFVAFTNQQEIQTATAGQTVFNLTTMSYQPGTNSLTVFVDGVNQYGPGAQYAYLETDSDTVTFLSGLHVGAEVKFTTSQLNSSVSQANAFQVSYTPPFTGSVGTNVGDKLAQTVSVKDFGAVGDGVTDDTVAIQAALDSGAGLIEANESSYLVTDTLVVPDGVAFVGKGRTATTIIVGADVVGVELGQYSQLRGFKIDPSVAHTNNGVDAGTPSRGGGRTIIEDVWVNSVGNDGIQVRNGNLGTLRDIVCTSNGRDGINFTTETANNNAWKLEGVIDVRSNTRDGLHFEAGSSVSDANAPRTNSCDYVAAQQNGRYGLYVGTRNNNFVLYSEANTTKDFYLDTFANGNYINVLEAGGTSSYVDNSSGSVISFHSAQADYVREYKTAMFFRGGASYGWILNNDDGTAGRLHVAKTSANRYSFSQDSGSSNALSYFEHNSAKHTLGATGGFVTSTTTVSIPTATATTVASFGVLTTDAYCGVIHVRDSGGTTVGSSAIVTNFTSGGAQVLQLSSVGNSTASGSSLTVSGGNIQFTHTFGSTRTFVVTLVQFGLGKSV